MIEDESLENPEPKDEKATLISELSQSKIKHSPDEILSPPTAPKFKKPGFFPQSWWGCRDCRRNPVSNPPQTAPKFKKAVAPPV